MKRFLIYIRLGLENVRMAFQTLILNKVRSILSVVGISIGIFSIISVFTIIDSLELEVKNSLATLGKSVVYVDVFPWDAGEHHDYPWWKFMQRPDPNLNEMSKLYESNVADLIDAISFKMTMSAGSITDIETGVNVNNASVTGVSYDFDKIQDLNFIAGRYFSLQESESGMSVAILGNTLATNIFNNPEFALGKLLRISGKLVRVIGVLDYEGANLMNSSNDEMVFVPIGFLYSYAGINTRNYQPLIMVKAKDNIEIDFLADEIKGAMRTIRKLKPESDDNFAINKVTFLIETLKSFFEKMNLFGLIIGGFALLVGGFGVANIMFVSVKERTGIIGIQKALGAKGIFILFQFLIEAIVLCLLGGLIGMLFVYIITLVGNYFLASSSDISFILTLTLNNIIIGILFSVITGVLAGIIPAWFAARMNPVDAIRANG